MNITNFINVNKPKGGGSDNVDKGRGGGGSANVDKKFLSVIIINFGQCG